MTTRQKTATARAAMSTSGQPSKPQASSLPASLDSVPLIPIESQTHLHVQPPSEMITMKDLQAALAMQTDNLKQMLQEQTKHLENRIEASNSETREEIAEVIKGVWDYTVGIEEKLEGVEQKLEDKIEEIKNDIQDQAVIIQYNQMQMAVRIRGFKEVPKETQEDLRKVFAEALATFLEDGDENVSWQIERIFRMNSRIAAQRNLPRDIVIYFNTRKFRNWVLTVAYNKQLSVAGQEVQVLKEIPPKMLRSRKDYAFLIEELKKREIQYRWEVPTGLSFFYQNNRYRLNTVAKAKDFLENILMAGKSTTTLPKRAASAKDTEILQSMELQLISTIEMDKGGVAEQPVQCIDIFQPLDVDKAKEQRSTREISKIKEQREKIQPTCVERPTLISMEAMGARPKRKEEVDLVVQKLSRKDYVK